MSPLRIVVIALLLLPVALAVPLLGMARFVAVYSPWGDFERHFSAPPAFQPGMPSQNSVAFSSANGRAFSFRGTVDVSLQSDGLYLELHFPFGLFRTPLLIPQSAVSQCHVENSAFGPSAGPSTNFMVAPLSAKVSVPDRLGTILHWCRGE